MWTLTWLILDGITVLWHIHFPPLTGDNMCRVNNGGCSTLCLAIPGGRVCACADNQLLDENGTTCICKFSLCFCICYTYCLYIYFWRTEAYETKGEKIKLGKRNSDNHLGIILFKLQIINWINLIQKDDQWWSFPEYLSLLHNSLVKYICHRRQYFIK